VEIKEKTDHEWIVNTQSSQSIRVLVSSCVRYISNMGSNALDNGYRRGMMKTQMLAGRPEITIQHGGKSALQPFFNSFG
jgi:hypothetical protein